MNWNAASEWIASVGIFTRADGIVADNAALGVRTANSGARIFAFLIDAGLIGWTVAVTDAFRPAIGNRTDHAILTAALGLIAHHLTLGIRT